MALRIDPTKSSLLVCEQGSPEWYQHRTGLITASKFRDALSKLSRKSNGREAGEPAQCALEYAARLAIEIVSGQSMEEQFETWAMKRGKDLEPAARMEYELRTGNLAAEAGVVIDESGTFGYSTDGFVGADGGIEIKCLVNASDVIRIWTTNDISEFQHQMQGGMWITGRQWIDFVLYCPHLSAVGKQLYIQRVHRDEAFIAELEAGLFDFARRVDEAVAVLRAPLKEAA